MKEFSSMGRLSPRQEWYLTLFYMLVVSIAVWLGCLWYFTALQDHDLLLVYELLAELTLANAPR